MALTRKLLSDVTDFAQLLEIYYSLFCFSLESKFLLFWEIQKTSFKT